MDKGGEENPCPLETQGLLASLVLPAYPVIHGTSLWGEALWARPGSGNVPCVGNFTVEVRWKGGIEFRDT